MIQKHLHRAEKMILNAPGYIMIMLTYDYVNFQVLGVLYNPILLRIHKASIKSETQIMDRDQNCSDQCLIRRNKLQDPNKCSNTPLPPLHSLDQMLHLPISPNSLNTLTDSLMYKLTQQIQRSRAKL